MSYYPDERGRSNRQQMLVMLLVGALVIAFVTFVSVAASMVGVPAGPIPAPAPGIP